jgi:hypothetical protein
MKTGLDFIDNAEEIVLDRPLAPFGVTSTENMSMSIDNFDHAIDLLVRGDIGGFECFTKLGTLGIVHYRIRRFGENMLCFKFIHHGMEGSGDYRGTTPADLLVFRKHHESVFRPHPNPKIREFLAARTSPEERTPCFRPI